MIFPKTGVDAAVNWLIPQQKQYVHFVSIFGKSLSKL